MIPNRVLAKLFLAVFGWALSFVLVVGNERSLIDQGAQVAVAMAVAGWVVTVERRLTRVIDLFEQVSKSVESIAQSVNPIVAALAGRTRRDREDA